MWIRLQPIFSDVTSLEVRLTPYPRSRADSGEDPEVSVPRRACPWPCRVWMNQSKQASTLLSVRRPVPSGFHFSSFFAHTEQIQLQAFALRPSGSRKSCATTHWIDIRVPYQRRGQMRSAVFLFACATGLALVAPPLSGDDDRRSTILLLPLPDRMKLNSSRPRSDSNKSRSISCCKRLDAQQNLLQAIHPAAAVTSAPVPASSPTQHPAGPALPRLRSGDGTAVIRAWRRNHHTHWLCRLLTSVAIEDGHERIAYQFRGRPV
jgi:hypothetical protein